MEHGQRRVDNRCSRWEERLRSAKNSDSPPTGRSEQPGSAKADQRKRRGNPCCGKKATHLRANHLLRGAAPSTWTRT